MAAIVTDEQLARTRCPVCNRRLVEVRRNIFVCPCGIGHGRIIHDPTLRDAVRIANLPIATVVPARIAKRYRISPHGSMPQMFNLDGELVQRVTSASQRAEAGKKNGVRHGRWKTNFGWKAAQFFVVREAGDWDREAAEAAGGET